MLMLLGGTLIVQPNVFSLFGVPTFAALLAGLITLIVTTLFNIRSAQNEIVKDYLEDLKKIEDLSIQYWLGDHEAKRDDLEKIAIELRARLTATGDFCQLVGKNGIVVAGFYSRFRKLDGQLFDLATGGSFQTAMMKADPATADQLIQILSEIRSLLRQSRVARYWFH
ncbi:hypothetical protein [Asticcacaulis sp. AC460]|uniref:hypothetical protein n=1 Tax=Asticcacaulis sp. AC460 TaxID=1282360 RepID=UPI0012DC1D47|nr:hypothetical protein [Asticcacaulis sp. AC460]